MLDGWQTSRILVPANPNFVYIILCVMFFLFESVLFAFLINALKVWNQRSNLKIIFLLFENQLIQSKRMFVLFDNY